MIPLRHPVPRLDAPDRVWMLPMPVAKWLAAGALSGPLMSTVLAYWQDTPPAETLNEPVVWIVWGVGLSVSALGAWVRPGGLHVARWAVVLLDYLLVPRRAVWRP